MRSLFPERQVFVRTGGRMRCYSVGSGHQCLAAVLAVVAGVWLILSSAGYVVQERELSARNDDLHNARVAYQALLVQLGHYQERVAEISRVLEDPHGFTRELVDGVQGAASEAGLTDKQVRLVGRLQDIEHSGTPLPPMKPPSPAETSSGQGASVRADFAPMIDRGVIRTELAALESGMEGLGAQIEDWLTGRIDDIEVEMRTLVLQRDLALGERDSLQGRLAALETLLTNLKAYQLEIYERLSEVAATSIRDLEKSLGATGLDVEVLLNELRGDFGQGGPFLPGGVVEAADPAYADSLEHLTLRMGQWEELRTLARTLPLMSPLERYRITSRFGNRSDPINRRAAFHSGLDLGAPMRSPVLAGGPGTVTFAGWRGNYGRLVEIDHGFGLMTRYAHLHKILVKEGDQVESRQKIGLLGVSGRTTGPHVHYEVLLKGTPQDPLKFIKAGRHVLKGQ